MDGLSATCVYDIKPGDETNSRAEDKKDSQTEDKTDPQVQPSENTINHDDIRTEIVEFEIKRLSRIMNMLVD